MPHPQVTIRNPPLLPLVPLRATLATTPQPSRVSIAVPNTSDRKTIPRDIFDSSIFCCQPVASLRGCWAGNVLAPPAGHCVGPPEDHAVLVPGRPPSGRRGLSGDQAVDPDAVEPFEHLLSVGDLGRARR